MSAYVAFVCVSLILLGSMPSFVSAKYTSRRPAQCQQVRAANALRLLPRGLVRFDPAYLTQASVLAFSRLRRSMGSGAWAAAKWSVQYLA